jgi:DUF4097 and DUF4098 domain-containing protein YvlB
MTRRLILLPLFTLAVAASPAAADEMSRAVVKRVEQTRTSWATRYQDSRQGPEQTERFSRTARIGANGAFELSNVAGDVVITGGGGEEVRVEAIKRVRHRDGGEAQSLLKELRIEAVEATNRLEIRTIYPRRQRSFSGSVDFTVQVPVGASVTVKTVSGDLRVKNVRGELRLETVSGDVITAGASRLASIKSVSGDIEVTDATADDLVNVSTVSGTVRVTGLKARAIEAGSVSGDVVLTKVQSDRISAKVVSGNVDFNGALARTGRYEFSSHSGDVRLRLGNTSGFELEATTFNGDVRSDFALTLRGASNDTRRRNRSIRGSFGDAGAILSLKSFNGDIVISK